VRQTRGREWKFAADNLLAACVPARVVAQLLPEAKVRILVRVHEEGTDLDRQKGDRGVACGRLKVPKGFPPSVFYRLTRDSAKNGEMIADGPEPIAMIRKVDKGVSISFSTAIESFDESQHAISLLRWITGDRAKESQLAAEIRIDHVWTNESNYVSKVGEDVQLRRAAWRTLVDALVARELLPAERRPTADPIQVE